MIKLEKIRARCVKNHKHSMKYLDCMEDVPIFRHAVGLIFICYSVGIVSFCIAPSSDSPYISGGVILIPMGAVLSFALNKIVSRELKNDGD